MNSYFASNRVTLTRKMARKFLRVIVKRYPRAGRGQMYRLQR